MAKVKITGHASGTGILTVTAPNTSTDRTITLPDATGTLAITTDDDDKLPLAGGTMTGNILCNDNVHLRCGTNSDLRLYHDGTNSYIGNYTGTLYVTSGNGETSMRLIPDGAAELYHNDAKKLETSATGITVTGNVVGDGADLDGAVTINDTGADVDFRVESDGNANMLTVNGGTNTVGIGTLGSKGQLHVGVGAVTTMGASASSAIQIGQYTGASAVGNLTQITMGAASNTNAPIAIGGITTSSAAYGKDDFFIATRNATTDTVPTERFRITADGRGVSQFTAHAWVLFDGTGTVAIDDSHNISSVSDGGTGLYTVNFSNNTAANHCTVVASHNYDINTSCRNHNAGSVQVNSFNVVGSGSGSLQDMSLFKVLTFGG